MQRIKHLNVVLTILSNGNKLTNHNSFKVFDTRDLEAYGDDPNQ